MDTQIPLNNNRAPKDKNLPNLVKQALDDQQRNKYHLNVTFHNKNKKTFTKGWNRWSKVKQTEKELINSYKNIYTCYGFVTGYNGLFGVDFDWEWPYILCKNHFQDRFDTYTVRTPNQGYRCLFFTNNPKNDDIFKNNLHVELQGGKAAIVAGEANDEKGNLGHYEPLKTDIIRNDPEIQKDITNFLNKTIDKCNFIKYKCISSSLKYKKNNLSHEQRTSIGALFVANDVEEEAAIDFFRTCPDFNYQITNEHVGRLYNKGFIYPQCETLRRNFNWDENNCSGCIRKKKHINKGQSDSEGAQNYDGQRNLTTRIVNEAQENTELLIDDRGVSYARFKVQNHFEIWPIRSRRFKGLLFRLGKKLNDDDVPASESITNAQNYLEALSFKSEENKLHNRVSKTEGALWYDLSNSEWQAVKISENGWEIVDHPPALFRREQHQKPQVFPNGEYGDIWMFFDSVNVSENKKLILLVYMVSCFIPDIPHPVIIIYGPPGSGKSMLMEFLRDIIDPSQVPKLKIPKGDKDIVQNFDHHYAPFFDNLDTIQPWLSDMICRAVTGEGSEHRQLYTDDDSVIRNYRRCVGLTGINVTARKGDLLDRGILIGLDQLQEVDREEEALLRKKFNENLPGILGDIFNILAKTMALYSSVKLKNLPRMADFAKWGYAIAEVIGNHGDDFIIAYSQDEEDRIMEALDANPLSTAIIVLMGEQPEWTGTPTELLNTLEEVAEREKINIRKSKTWPKSPAWITRRLNEIESGLITAGIEVEQHRDGQKRTITILKPKKNDDNDDSAVIKLDNDNSDINDSKMPKSTGIR